MSQSADYDAPLACRYPCDCGQFPEEHCACMDGHVRCTHPPEHVSSGGLRWPLTCDACRVTPPEVGQP